jgi:hypothetical protein
MATKFVSSAMEVDLVLRCIVGICFAFGDSARTRFPRFLPNVHIYEQETREDAL